MVETLAVGSIVISLFSICTAMIAVMIACAAYLPKRFKP